MEQVKFVDKLNHFSEMQRYALIKGANIMGGQFRNFSGKKEGTGKYKIPAGKRFFKVQIDDPKNVAKLISERYNVKTQTDDYGTIERGYLLVNLKPELPQNLFPCIVKIETSGEKSTLPVEQYDLLDGLGEGSDTMITSADLVLRLYDYNGDGSAFSAQLEEGTFHLQPISFWTDIWAEEEFPSEE